MYTMRVIYVEADLAPRIIDIPHTLPDMQALVGGMIEIVEPFDDPGVVLVCDECGRNDGKPVNRIINERIDVCGSFFICGHNGEELCSIPEAMIFKYVSMFRCDDKGRTEKA